MALAFVWSVVMLIALLSLPGDERTNIDNLFTWFQAGNLQGAHRLPRRPAVGHLDPAGHRRRLADPPLRDRLHARRRALLALLRLLQPVRRRDARSSSSAASFLLTFLGWEGVGLCSYLLDRLLVRAHPGVERVAEGVRHQPRRRLRLHDRDVLHRRRARQPRLLGDERRRRRPLEDDGHGDRAAALRRLHRQERADRSAHLAARRDGGPDPGLGADPRRDDGDRRRLPACAAPTRSSSAAAPRSTSSRSSGRSPRCIAGTVALVQPDIKRVLAYSTISQLGYMFLAVRRAARTRSRSSSSSSHAFYKATLFLGAGTVIHGTHDNQDVRTMGGLRRFMPVTALAFTIATLAIAGVPPLAGFWAKDDAISRRVLRPRLRHLHHRSRRRAPHRALHDPRGAARLLRQRAVPPAGRGRRWPRRPAPTTPRREAEPARGRAPPSRTSPRSPTVDYGTPPAAAGAGRAPRGAAAIDGGAGPGRSRSSRSSADCSTCPFTKLEFLTDFLDPVFAVVAPPEPTSFWSGVRARRHRGDGRHRRHLHLVADLPRRPRGSRRSIRSTGGSAPLGRLFGHAYYYDEGIAAAVGGPIRRGAQWLADVFDQKIIDGAVNGIARGFGAAGTQVRKLQTGLVRQYALGIVLGDRRVADLGRDPGGDLGVGGFPILTAIIVTPMLGALAGAAHAGAPARDRPRGRASSRRSRRSASRSCCSGTSRPASAASSSSSRTAGSTSLGVGYIVGVDGFSLFMVVDHRGAVPDRPARLGARHRAPGQGVHLLVPAARGRDHGDLPLPRPHRRSSSSGRRCSSRCTSSSPDGGAEPQVRGDEVLHLHRGRLGVPARRAPGARRSCTRPTPASSRSTTGCSPTGAGSRSRRERWLFLGFMVAFAIKAPLVPFHTWLPDVHTEAPTAGSVVLAGVILKMGAYGVPALRVRALPARVGLLRAAVPHARGDRHRLRVDRRRDAEGRETRDRVLVGRAHGLHPPRHLLDHGLRSRRRRVHDGEPPAHDRRAVPRDRHALRAPPHPPDRRLRRHLEVGAQAHGALPRSRCSPGSGCPAFSGFVGEFLVAGRHVHRAPLVGGRRDGRRDPRRGLHALDVPAGVHRRARGRERHDARRHGPRADRRGAAARPVALHRHLLEAGASTGSSPRSSA